METLTVEQVNRRVSKVEGRLATVQAQVDSLIGHGVRDDGDDERDDRSHAVAVLDRIIQRNGGAPEVKRHPRELRAQMLARGVGPTENLLSREIIRMREE